MYVWPAAVLCLFMCKHIPYLFVARVHRQLVVWYVPYWFFWFPVDFTSFHAAIFFQIWVISLALALSESGKLLQQWWIYYNRPRKNENKHLPWETHREKYSARGNQLWRRRFCTYLFRQCTNRLSQQHYHLPWLIKPFSSSSN